MKLIQSALQALILTCFAAAAIVAQDGAAERLPAAAFAGLETFYDPKLSPDGKQIAYFTAFQGRRAGIIQNLDGSDRVLVPNIKGSDIIDIYWANNDRLLLIFEKTLKRVYFRNKTAETRLISISRDGSDSRAIVLGEKQRTSYAPAQAPFQHDIINMLPDEPDHILLALDNDLDGAVEVRRININTGRYRIVRDDTRGIQAWYTDHEARIRLGVGYDRLSSEWDVRIYDKKGQSVREGRGSWRKRYDIAGFGVDPNMLYVRGPGDNGLDAIYKLSIETGEIESTVFADPVHDVEFVVSHPDTGIPAGAGYVDDYFRITYFDPALARVQKLVDNTLKGRANIIVDKALGQDIYIIKSAHSTDPGSYYWFDVKAKKLAYIAPAREPIYPENMAVTDVQHIEVRDGTLIPTYITTPRGRSGAMPTIILPHGGPHARSGADWDFLSQFLANRGYRVIQPNFRGSTGYGRAWRWAGYNQWGGLMQHDVTDVTRWVIDSGLTEPAQMCIVGWSYGGYAALMGAVMEQELYQCAVTINGVTDLPHLKAQDKNFLAGKDWIKRMGLKGAPDKQVSPKHRVDDITVPVLIVQSKDDARVPWQQATRMADALKKAGKPYELMLTDIGGGHSLVDEAARTEMLTRLEAFLAEHLPANLPSQDTAQAGR